MYSYEQERPRLFTDEGQRMFLKIRDRVKSLIRQAGAVRMQEAIRDCIGSSWQMIACIERMVELGELVEITSSDVAGQYRVFVSAQE